MQIYSLELAVYKIELEPDVPVPKNLSDLQLGFTFENKVDFVINTQQFSPPILESNGRTINMNYGKTCLFIAKPVELRQLLETESFKITFFDGSKVIGTASCAWKKEFSEMVKFFETLGIVKSTADNERLDLKDDQGKKTSRVTIFLRMSCFGSNVQTMFQIKQGLEDKAEYIFRQRNRSKSFKVEKYIGDQMQPIIAPLYGAVTDPKSEQESLVNMRENASLTQLWDRPITAKVSSFHTPEGEQGFNDNYDTVSICFRPTENKFFEFLNVISENVKTEGDTINLSKHEAKRVESFMRSIGGTIKDRPNFRVEEDGAILSTAEDIGKKLCGNKDCPAVKKFKEYGIGPLATGKNLGTLYNDVEPHVTYGMSQTYGTLSSFGPFGLLTKPEEEVPAKQTVECTDERERSSEKPCKIRKVTKSKKSKKEKPPKEPQWHSQSCPLCPGRLRGGSDGFRRSMDSDDPLTEIVDGEVMQKSPMIECKSVMDQFDSILAEYKKALGPCGHATCPNAQNIIEDACMKGCNQFNSPPSKGSTMSCSEIPCDMEACPYAGEQTQKKRYPSGCGSQKCAYTKYKLGLVDDDAEMELQFLPPALAGNCGSPQCKYPLAPPLPPIHWDCPDPLPRGQCQNLNCPFQPVRLRKFKTKKELKTGPCGSPMCPYALPQPCAIPTCPFSARPCPMSQGQNQESGENLCENPECPFAEANAKIGIRNQIDDPNFKGEFQDCSNDDCPNKEKTDKKKVKRRKEEFKGEFQNCGNDDCANEEKTDKKKVKSRHHKEKRSRKKEDKKRNKDNGHIKARRLGDRNDDCEDPECPFNVPKARNEKKKRNKKKRPTSQDSAYDACCEMNEKKVKKEKNRCLESSSENNCSDGDCPYAELRKQRQGEGDADDTTCNEDLNDSVCSNPDCPERPVARKKRSSKKHKVDPNACPVPGCPYSNKRPKSTVCEDPECPYLKPLPSCGIPNCPYEPVPVMFNCENQECPSHKVDFSKKIDGNRPFVRNKKMKRSRQGPKDSVPQPIKTTTVCDDAAPCDKADDCENPDCEMKEENNQKPPPSEQAVAPATNQKKKKKRKKKGKFVYTIGDTYPITKLGHRECVMPVFNVPPHMGWLWNIYKPILQLKPRRGWRPGALSKTIAARIRAHRESKGLGQMRIPNFTEDGTKDDEGAAESKVVPKPTLEIHKKEGAYWITMNPLKDPFSLVENEDPYMDCTPMTFKITKNKKDKDYCYCDGDAPPESSSSSDSELDIEFTPPGGIVHPERFKKKPNIVCCDSQYDPKDFEVEKKEAPGKKAKGKGKDKKGGGKGDGGKGGGKGGKKGGKKK